MIKNTIKTISIGIPAFNEEKNIAQLLQSIFAQKVDGYMLNEILIISDGSTDYTADRVKEFADKRIKLTIYKKRTGKSAIITQILKDFNSDVLFLIDADTLILDTDTFSKMIHLGQLEKSGIAAPKFIPMEGNNYLEKALNYSVRIQNNIKRVWNNGRNYLVIKGCFLALDRTYAKSVQLPEGIINDDAFFYFKAIQSGYTPKYLSDVSVYYRSPSILSDHIQQSSRFQISHDELKKYFADDLKREYQIPRRLKLKYGLKYGLKNPYLFLSYTIIFLLTKIYKKKLKSNKWHIASSTKTTLMTPEQFKNETSTYAFHTKMLIQLRKLIYILLYAFDRSIGAQPGIVILCYHSVHADGWRFSVDLQTLQNQIDFLLKKNYQFVSLMDVQNHIEGKTILQGPSVVLTFDDGYKDLVQTMNYFIKNNLHPTVFLLGDSQNANRKELDTYRPFLNTQEIQVLIENGWIVGCHSGTHSDLSTLDKIQLQKEITGAKKELETELKRKIHFFAYPKGKYNDSVLHEIETAKYTLAVTMDDGFISTTTNKYKIPRIGIDRTHSIQEFPATFSPSVIKFRMFVKHKLGIVI